MMMFILMPTRDILQRNSKKFRFSFAISNIPLIFAVPNSLLLVNTAEHSDRCSIRNWAFFMSIGLLASFIR